MKNKLFILLILLLSVVVYPFSCSSERYVNITENLTTTVEIIGNYTFVYQDFNRINLSNYTNNSSFIIPTSYTYTRVYFEIWNNSSHPSTKLCENYSLVQTSAEYSYGQSYLASLFLTFLNDNIGLIIGVFSFGIVYGLSMRIGTTCIGTAIVYIGAYLLFSNPLWLLGAITLFTIGMVAQYVGI